MKASRCATRAVFGAVDLHVVVGRIDGTVGESLGDQPEELVLELVGDRVADQREVGLPDVEHVLDDRVVRPLPVEALLDVGLLADDPGFEHGEVASLRGGERLGHEVLEGPPLESRLAWPFRPGGNGPGDGRVEEAYLGEVWSKPFDLDEEAAALAVERVVREAAGDGHRNVGEVLAFGEVGDSLCPRLGG